MRWCVLIAVLTWFCPGASPAADSVSLLTDFSQDLPLTDGTYRDACFTLRFAGIRPLPGGDEFGDVFVQLRRRNGEWDSAGHTAAADYNQRSENRVAVKSLEWDGTKLRGHLQLTIGPDSPRPRVKGFPAPADEFEITLEVQRKPGVYLPWQPKVQAFMPPWRTDEPRYGGEILTGNYDATLAGKKLQGGISGAVQPVEADDTFGTSGNAVITPAPGGGMQVVCRMAPQRVMGPERAMASRRFRTARDWSGYSVVRLRVDSSRKRDDAAVALVLRDAGGRESQVTTAALLRGREEVFDVPLDAQQLDIQRISSIAVGVDNCHGVGDVAFIIRRIELLPAGITQPASTAPVRLTVDPETVVSINGVATVPKGLFGFHDVNESQPRTPTTREAGAEDYLRALNPGLLRPLSHVNFGLAKPLTDEQVHQHLVDRPKSKDGVLLARAKAADAVDNVIWTHTADLWARPAWMDEPLSKTADAVRCFYRNLAADAYVPGDEDNLLRQVEVWNEPFMWARHINTGKLNPPGKKAWTDPTQYGYLPAKACADAWSDLFLAAVEGAKSSNPNLRLGGPSCPELSADDFGMFENYVLPILDRCGGRLSFLTEHHYGGKPRIFAAGYDVFTAACDQKVQRRIPVIVTETNDLGASSAGKASYNIEDILTCLRQCPDQLQGRAMHALWSGYLNDEGELHAYTLLSKLRGTMLLSTSSDDDVTVAAAMPQSGEVVVVAHNRSRLDRRIELDGVAAMQATECMILLADSSNAELKLNDTEGQPVAKPASGKTRLVSLPAAKAAAIDLPPRSAVRWTFQRSDDRPKKVQTTQSFYVDILLKQVMPDTPATARVLWRAHPPLHPGAAGLRIVTRDVQAGEAVAMISGRSIPLPASSSNESSAVIQDVPLDPSLLSQEMVVEFRCTDPARQNGFEVYSASIRVTDVAPR